MINLHIVRNTVYQDSRVLKETLTIDQSEIFERVEISGMAESAGCYLGAIDERVIRLIGLRSRSLPKHLFAQLIKYLEWHWRVVTSYQNASLQVIHCHDLEPLLIGVHLKMKTGAKLIYDAHELESERNGQFGLRKLLTKVLERFLMPFVDVMITVSPSIQSWYQHNFSKVPVYLIRNIPNSFNGIDKKIHLREILKIPDDSLLFIYFGGFIRGRGIELCLEAFKDPSVNHHIVFMGSGSLETAILEGQRHCERIHILPPVSPEKVVEYARGADIGVSCIEDTCLSYRYCLPNKLFESLLGGIPVLVTDLLDQAKIVREFNAGWIIGFSSKELVELLSKLTFTEGVDRRTGLADRIRSLSWDQESQILLQAYRHCISG